MGGSRFGLQMDERDFMQPMISFVFAALLASQIFLAPATARASDAAAQRALDEAKKHFVNRDQSGKNELAINAFQKAAASATDAKLKYEALWRLSYALHWRALNQPGASKDAKMKIYAEAMKAADDAKKLNPEGAEGHYYYGFALMRWMGNAPPFQAGMKMNELSSSFGQSARLKQMNGQSGAYLDGYGAYRYTGIIAYRHRNPDRAQALKSLRLAYKNAPQRVENVTFLAEVLWNKGEGASNPQEACQMLRDVLGKNVNSFSADTRAEAVRELKSARELADKACKSTTEGPGAPSATKSAG